ncbi:unnamed protein product, partial [Rotaria sp. Silwood2]
MIMIIILFFVFLQLIETNKCILITTTTINQYENLNPSRTSTITNNTQNDESIETTTIINEQIKINNKNMIIELNLQILNIYLTQAFLYQLTKRKMILLINTTDCIHSYSIQYDQITLTLTN